MQQASPFLRVEGGPFSRGYQHRKARARRLLRDVAENRPLGDTTALADPTVVDGIRQPW